MCGSILQEMRCTEKDLYLFLKLMAKRIRSELKMSGIFFSLRGSYMKTIKQYTAVLSIDLLPELVFTCQTFPGPQNTVLRCGAISFLRHD